jgi:hypothetical protein
VTCGALVRHSGPMSKEIPLACRKWSESPMSVLTLFWGSRTATGMVYRDLHHPEWPASQHIIMTRRMRAAPPRVAGQPIEYWHSESPPAIRQVAGVKPWLADRVERAPHVLE